MKITFYKNTEFMGIRYLYSIKEGKEKGTFYAKILNQIDIILNWLEEFSEITQTNTTEKLIFPTLFSKTKKEFSTLDRDVIDIIKKEIDINFKKQKELLEMNKQRKERYVEKKAKDVVISLDEKIIKIQDRIKNKVSVLNEINGYKIFLNKHRQKVNYFIIKENNFRDEITTQEINSFFSSRIKLPSVLRELYFEEKGVLRRPIIVYERSE